MKIFVNPKFVEICGNGNLINRCAAPKVKPYMAPPNPLDLYEDLEDALTAAEDRIGKLKAEKAVFEARLARQDELIAELLQHKAASDKRFEELESALADHNTRAASRNSMRPPPSSPPPSPTLRPHPAPPARPCPPDIEASAARIQPGCLATG